MKGKNKNNNDKKARKPVVNEDSLYTEALESSENKPTEDFMEAPIESSKKSVTLNELAEIDPELLTGRSENSLPCPITKTIISSRNRIFP